MFTRKTRATLGRRLADTRSSSGVPLDLLYIAFALGLVLGVYFARRQGDA